ncbi:hypothetical protein [Streptomyces graminilatus]|uniref:hypothetical protein n=1 Tax=Streptomyces graminilatus TaxID=1464070 RepID=UPI0006E2FF2C|nr:hypothetical protein [Streptomyces graminilatus]
MVVFPEAQPPGDPLPDAATARYLLTEAQGRLADARRQQQAHPGLLVFSDRCQARAHARTSTAPWNSPATSD